VFVKILSCLARNFFSRMSRMVFGLRGWLWVDGLPELDWEFELDLVPEPEPEPELELELELFELE